jgi:hypothetical protein
MSLPPRCFFFPAHMAVVIGWQFLVWWRIVGGASQQCEIHKNGFYDHKFYSDQIWHCNVEAIECCKLAHRSNSTSSASSSRPASTPTLISRAQPASRLAASGLDSSRPGSCSCKLGTSRLSAATRRCSLCGKCACGPGASSEAEQVQYGWHLFVCLFVCLFPAGWLIKSLIEFETRQE